MAKGAAQRWQMVNRGKPMVADKFDFGFAVDWMRKDLGLVLDEAKRHGARLPEVEEREETEVGDVSPPQFARQLGGAPQGDLGGAASCEASAVRWRVRCAGR